MAPLVEPHSRAEQDNGLRASKPPFIPMVVSLYHDRKSLGWRAPLIQLNPDSSDFLIELFSRQNFCTSIADLFRIIRMYKAQNLVWFIMFSDIQDKTKSRFDFQA
jgi:hypothetical protein